MTALQTPSRLALGIMEAVEQTGLSRSTLYLEIKAGRLRTIKIGKRRLIPHADLIEWLDTCREAA